MRRKLGSGGMGVVYEAYDHERGHDVALKTLVRPGAQSIQQIKREFRALQGISHPNLITLHELFEVSGKWFFTMDLVHGSDFLAYVRGAPVPLPAHSALSTAGGDTPADSRPFEERGVWGSLNEDLLRPALIQLAAALAALHETGRTHRDVKPSNVLVRHDGHVVLVDFGLVIEDSQSLESDSTAHAVVGTAHYMAPEQVVNSRVGPPADWYAMGVLLYEALSGRLPFDGSPLRVLTSKQTLPPPDVRVVAPTAPDDLATLCAELLQIDPTARPTFPEVYRRLGGRGKRASTITEVAQGSTSDSHLFGRDAEYSGLTAAYERARKGRLAVATVAGVSGVGKSVLVQHFATQLGQDALVFHGRCHERESIPYKAFDGVVEGLSRWLRRQEPAFVSSLVPDHADVLPRLFPTLGRVAQISRAPEQSKRVKSPHDLRTRGFGALRGLFQRLAMLRTMVIVIDDLQWADVDSLILLRELLRSPMPPPFALISTCRSGEWPSGADGQAFEFPCEITTIELGPLTPLAATGYSEKLLAGWGFDRVGVAEQVAKESAGHPLFIDMIVRHMAATGNTDATQFDLKSALTTQFSSLSEEARSLLEVICLSNAPLPQHVIATASGISPDQMSKLSSTLRVASLVSLRGSRRNDPIEPYHGRVRDAVREHVPADAAREIHRRLAAAIQASPEEFRPEFVIAHLEAAGESSRAAGCALEGARRASHALAFDRAAEFLRDALRLGEFTSDECFDLRLELAEALANAGRSNESADEFDALATTADPATQLLCRRRSIELFMLGGQIARGLEGVRTLLANSALKLPRTVAGSYASLLWRRFRLRLRGSRWTEVHESQVSRHRMYQLDLLRTVGHSLAFVNTVMAADFSSRYLLEARRTGEPFALANALTAEAMFLRALGETRRSHALLLETGILSERLGDPSIAAFHIGAKASHEYFDCRFDDCLATSAKQDALLDQLPGNTVAKNARTMFGAYCLRLGGRWNEFDAFFAERLNEALGRGDRYIETVLSRYAAFLPGLRGRMDEARELLRVSTWRPPEGLFLLPDWHGVEAHVEIALLDDLPDNDYLEITKAITRARKSYVFRVQMTRVASLSMIGRMALHRAWRSSDRESRHLAAANAKRLSKENSPFAAAWSSAIHASLAALDDDVDAQLRHLTLCIERSRVSQTPLLAEVARWRIGQLLGGERGAQQLNEAENFLAQIGNLGTERLVKLVLPGWSRA